MRSQNDNETGAGIPPAPAKEDNEAEPGELQSEVVASPGSGRGAVGGGSPDAEPKEQEEALEPKVTPKKRGRPKKRG